MMSWTEVEPDSEDVVALWEHPDDMRIKVEEVVVEAEETIGELLVVLERTVRADGYEADVETFAAGAINIDKATELVTTMIDEIDHNVVTAIAATEHEIDDEEIIHFHCVFEETIPDDVGPDDLVLGDAPNSVELESTVDADVPADSNVIRVDIYPVFGVEVREVDDE